VSLYEELIAKQRADVFARVLSTTRSLSWSAERLAGERERRLRDLLVWSAQHSPFWRERLAGHDLAAFTEDQLPALPVLTKRAMMQNFDALVTDRTLTLDRANEHVERLVNDAYLDGQYRVVATSGSGGTRGLFVYGWDDWITFVALATRWRGRTGQDLDASIGTLFASNAKHVSGALHAFSKDLSGTSTPPVTHLPATMPIPEIVAGLNDSLPKVLQGYPSVVHLLALEARAGRLSVRPTWVSTCGEQCTDEAREAVRSAWDIEIYDYWGCSEGVYAFPCAIGQAMHLPDDLTIIEPVDQDNNPVPYGQPADKLLLTNLYNRTQPLIRYEITDSMTVVDVPCECGCAHRQITNLRGRSDSFFKYEGGGSVFSLAIETVLLADPHVVEMQVTQTPRGAVVSIVTRETCNVEALHDDLRRLMIRSGLLDPHIVIRQVDSLDRMWSGKLRTFEPLTR
jgi:phenylacetate-CoA ligase